MRSARLAVGSAIVTLASALIAPAAPAQPVRPNVLIILTDDQRFDQTLSVMPSTRRWFARRGTTFANAFATTPLCCPSRASIFSGRYAHNHTVVSNQRGAEEDFDQSATIQAYLDDAGYRTGFFGKYFNAWDVRSDPPSFDRWAIDAPNGATGYAGDLWNVEGRQRTVDEYSTAFIGEQGLRFLRSSEGPRDDTPWFLELSTFAPHTPAIPAARYAEAPVPAFSRDPSMEERDLSDKPAWLRRRTPLDMGVMTGTRADELRCLMSVDDVVHDVFAQLRAGRELHNTLAFFLSDNGTLWGAHGIRGKETPYLPSIRVPMLARWPRHLEAGAVDRRIVANIDLAPTILEAAGITPSTPMDGRSLFGSAARSSLLIEYWRLKHPSDIPTWAAIYRPRFEYVEYYGRGSIVFREFYDLRTDPWELTNLLHDGSRSNDPDVRRLSDRLDGLRGCVGNGCP